MPRYWREWFVPPEEQDSEVEQLDQVRQQSGAGHRDEEQMLLKLKRKSPPRCAGCKRYMGFADGMYIIVSGDWRLHIKCFENVLEKHFKDGEILDLDTGEILNVDTEAE